MWREPSRAVSAARGDLHARECDAVAREDEGRDKGPRGAANRREAQSRVAQCSLDSPLIFPVSSR